MAGKATQVKEFPTREERLSSLIIQYADLQQQESGLRKAKEHIRPEIESLFPPIPEGGKEVKVEVDEIVAKFYLAESLVIEPESLWGLEAYRDTFWRLVKIPVTEARAILPGDILHEVSHIEVSPKPQLLIRKKAE